jgi:hypothetical protein
MLCNYVSLFITRVSFTWLKLNAASCLSVLICVIARFNDASCSVDFCGKGDELRCFTMVVMVLKSVFRNAIKLRL